ncbi:MAG: DUF1501 domain-containing protein [Verrucomicrobiae bacterium]|nr:DUF1501 domain-containing protein [Verrucomicrobiae bacterium]
MKSNQCHYACGSDEHLIARRPFLGSLIAGGAALSGLSSFANPAVSAQLASQQKRMLVIRMHGGLSQLESWDPKPGTDTGGPYRAIPTSVPGMHISELLPYTAKKMHHLSLVRSINTKNGDHSKGTYMMLTGRHPMPGTDYPEIGAVVAKSMDEGGPSLPGHVKISANGTGARSADAAYLGPKYASMSLGGDKPLTNSTRPSDLSEDSAKARDEIRSLVNNRFGSKRRTAETDAYVQSFEQAEELVKRAEVFDLSQESKQDRERYGSHDFGRHCLLARRLLENDITCVQVSHSNYDTHNENFNFHHEQLGEFDRPFSILIDDLHQRGMLESTLVVVLSEFGRTPKINARYGRDHWGNAWSVCLGGCGIQPGAIYGKTNANGTEVTDDEVDAGHLFHTYLKALGLRSTSNFEIGGRKFPIADPAFEPIKDILT